MNQFISGDGFDEQTAIPKIRVVVRKRPLTMKE
jgi:hypothetical protein